MIAVRLNGESRTFDDGTTVEAMLKVLGLGPQRVAVERNRRLVERAAFPTTVLADGDAIEVVHLVGGG